MAALSRKRVLAWGRDENVPSLDDEASRVREDARPASACPGEDGLSPYPERPYVPLVLVVALAFAGSQLLALQEVAPTGLLALLVAAAALVAVLVLRFSRHVRLPCCGSASAFARGRRWRPRGRLGACSRR